MGERSLTLLNMQGLEVGMGRARHVVRYVGRGTVMVKKIYFRPASARARIVGPRAELPFSLFFSLKLSRIQKTP